MTRSQIFLVAAFTVAFVCAATWLVLSGEPGTAPDVVDAAVMRTTPLSSPLPAAPASGGAQ
jgi:hypothetical protein